MAEVTVREMKKLLEKTGQNWPKFQSALREYRNTPRFDGMSPAQWLFSHRQRTNAMAIPNAYARVTDEMFKKHLDLRGCEQSRIAERIHSSKPEQFHPGAKVWIQDPKSKRWSIEAVIVSSIGEGTFLVNDGTREFTRNRRFIRPAATSRHESAPQTGCVTNDRNTQERLDDQFAANQRRQRRSRRTKPKSKKRG